MTRLRSLLLVRFGQLFQLQGRPAAPGRREGVSVMQPRLSRIFRHSTSFALTFFHLLSGPRNLLQ